MTTTVCLTLAKLCLVFSDYFNEVASEILVPFCRTLTITPDVPETISDKQIAMTALINMINSNPNSVLSEYVTSEAVCIVMFANTIHGFESFAYENNEYEQKFGIKIASSYEKQ